MPERGAGNGSAATASKGDVRDDAAEVASPAPSVPAMLRPWTWPLSRIGLAVYLTVLVVYIVAVGVPTDRIGQTGWIVIGIVAARLGRPLREHVRAVLDWLPLLAALILYDHTRGIADSLGMTVRVTELVDVERSMFAGILPSAWLQERYSDPADPQWWDAVASLVYTSHFVLPWAVAAVLYVRSRPAWLRYVRWVVLLSYAGLATYILVPAAPPWYASRYEFVPEQIDRVITNGWAVLGLRSAGAWLDQAQAGSNLVAALPSLHAAFAVLVSVALWLHVRNRALRVLIALYPVAMGLTLVYGGEHYVVDVLLGWVYVALVFLVSLAWTTWRSAAPGDPADEVAGAVGVLGPDQDLVTVPGAADGAADPGRAQRSQRGLEVGGGQSSGDGEQEAVLWPRRSDGGLPAPGRPPDDEQ
ncbi:MAG: phosphatase PAP2 family protein [Jiangellaceae bacterium]